MKNRITGRSAFLALLKDEGITHLFGNPGTTELPIMHALKDHPDLTYVMAMQESLVVAIADGFSRASGRLVACNVHVAPGLGNAMGSLFNASFTGTPMILAGGQDHRRAGKTRIEERAHRIAESRRDMDVAGDEAARGAAEAVGDGDHQAFLHRHHISEVGMVLQHVHDRQFGGAGIAEQMRDALVLEQCEERRAPRDAIHEVLPFPATVTASVRRTT